MRSLWRALALAWLGGVGSPALSEDAVLFETSVEVVRDDTRNSAGSRGSALFESSAGGETLQVATRDFSPGSRNEDR